MITLIQAIQSLVPGAEVSVGIYNNEITWVNPTVAPVTVDQIQEEQRRLQAEYDRLEYQRNRAREYPSIEEQLDALYHAGVFPPYMADRIRAVKGKYLPPTMTREEWLERQARIVTKPVAQPEMPRPLGTPAPTMTAEQWLAAQLQNSPEPQPATPAPTMTAEQWLAQQTTNRSMTREEWLASQVQNAPTPQPAPPAPVFDPVITPSTAPAITSEQWLAQQAEARPMTREEWLASQQNL
jgi:hypothetical protein